MLDWNFVSENTSGDKLKQGRGEFFVNKLNKFQNIRFKKRGVLILKARLQRF